ncbi:MAG: hypothetical protein M9930_15710, partial [Anaerolineae bacterium]|nr:hypothetical protein [Anaerolineae bacterium]
VAAWVSGLHRLFWARYFRERDYFADQFVVRCELKDELLEYLEEKRFYDTSVPYMLGWRPANEQRIDKLIAESLTYKANHESSQLWNDYTES